MRVFEKTVAVIVSDNELGFSGKFQDIAVRNEKDLIFVTSIDDEGKKMLMFTPEELKRFATNILEYLK